MRPSQWFWGTGKKGHLFQGNGNKGQIWRGTGEQSQYWGTGNIRKQIFDFWGTGEQAIYIRETREQVPPWEGLSYGQTFAGNTSCCPMAEYEWS